MGLCQSKPQGGNTKVPSDASIQATPSPVKPRETEDVEIEMEIGESDLTEQEFSLVGLSPDSINPSLNDFTNSSGIEWLTDKFDGGQMNISLTAPIEFVARVWLNTAVSATKGTDIGDVIRKLGQADTKKLLDGVATLQTGALLTASDQLISLIEQVPLILDAHEHKSEEVGDMIADFKDSSKECISNAQRGFNDVGTNAVDERIRAVQICVSALIATKCSCKGKGPLKLLRKNVETEIFKLLKLDRILSDARHSCSLLWSEDVLALSQFSASF